MKESRWRTCARVQWPPGSFEKRDISVIFMDHLHNCPECLCSGL